MRDTLHRIQLRRTKGWRKPGNTVVVARPTKWGNRFHIGLPANPTAADSVRRFREEQAPEHDEFNLRELRGKNLACWCRLCAAHADGKPLGITCDACAPCHADVLLELANGPLRCEAV